MNKYGLTVGNPAISSTGPIAFGPDGILFMADSQAAAVFAIDVADPAEPGAVTSVDVADLDAQLASYLGVRSGDVHIRGMAVHPVTQAVYLSVMRGRGETQPVLVRVGANADITDVPLTEVAFDQVSILDAPLADDSREDVRLNDASVEGVQHEYSGVTFTMAKVTLRSSTVTDLAWVDGVLLVAGASNEEFASTLRRIPFPFTGQAESNSLEIYHVSHGMYETASPIRTLVPFDGNTSVLASYTCTPLVCFSLTDLQPDTLIKGRTVAELGAINQPLDMVSYTVDDNEFLLVSNTRHPLLKIPAASIAGQEALHEPREPLGVPRTELSQEGVSFLANLGAAHVVMLQRDDAGAHHLRTYATASL